MSKSEGLQQGLGAEIKGPQLVQSTGIEGNESRENFFLVWRCKRAKFCHSGVETRCLVRRMFSQSGVLLSSRVGCKRMGLFGSKTYHDLARFVIILPHVVIFEAGIPSTCPMIHDSMDG